MSNRLVIYPANIESLPLLRNKLFQNVDEIICVAPSGWGVTHKDIGDLDLGKKTGLIISSNFEEALEKADAVFFIKTQQELDKDKFILSKIKHAIENKKDIVCTIDLSKEEYTQLKNDSKNLGCNFDYYNNNFFDVEKTKEFLKNQPSLTNIKTPIVMISEIISNIGGFDTQLAFKTYLENQGYKVSLISSSSYGSFFNNSNCPGFLFSQDFSESDKIILFNHYVKNIEISESPDIIIIGAPGALIPLTKARTESFGIPAYLMTRGAMPDASIVCSYSDQYTKKYFDEMNPTINYRFSMNTVGYLINNTILDFFSVEGTEDPRRIMIEQDLVKQRIPKEVADFVYPIKERDKLFEKVIDKLAFYGEVQEL